MFYIIYGERLTMYTCKQCSCPLAEANRSAGRAGLCKPCYAAKMAPYMRTWRRDNRAADMIMRARLRAKRSGLPFDLSAEDLTIPVKCPVTGRPLEWGEGHSPDAPTLDRLVPDLGYVRGNVRVISHAANAAKGSASPEDLALLARVRGSGSTFDRASRYVQRALHTERLISTLQRRVGDNAPEEVERVAAFLRRHEAGLAHPMSN